mmetsp:Transcript_3916/g.12770  ORF Transcript_3916/g.12770 Transcript_3916/m.12770 type:complete len:170 (+) Transcript_3916:260-769(+)
MMDKLLVPYLHPSDVAAYVSRPAIERRIIDHVSESRQRKTLVVVGSRGVGKSFLVSKLLKERRNGVYVKLRAQNMDILEVLRVKLEIKPSEVFAVEDLFLPFAELYGTEKPVLVVEIEGTVKHEATVGSQSQILKALCDDLSLARGILIPSNANAAAWLKQDARRQNFL